MIFLYDLREKSNHFNQCKCNFKVKVFKMFRLGQNGRSSMGQND